jgi:hypothetical protein
MHICDHAMVDPGGKATIIGEFDTIHSSHFPTKHLIFFIAIKWDLYKNESFRYRLNLVAPDGTHLFPKADTTVPASEGDRRHTSIDAFIGTDFPTTGEYLVEVLVDRNPIFVQSLNVVQS